MCPEECLSADSRRLQAITINAAHVLGMADHHGQHTRREAGRLHGAG